MSEINNKNKSFLSSILFVALAASFCSFLWGSATPCIKIGYKLFSIAPTDTATVILFAGVRFFVAGILTAIVGSLMERKFLFPASKGAWGKVFVLSMFQTVIQYFFFYGGLTKASGVTSALTISTNVFASLLIAVFVFRQEKLSALKVVGCVVGFSGVALVNAFGSSGSDYHVSFLGEGFIFLSSICYGFSGGFSKKFSKTENPVMLSGYQFIVGGFIMIVVGYLFGGRFSGFTPKSVLLLGYLAFISACAYSLWGILLKYNDVSKVVIFGFLNPVFGVILSMIFLHERGQNAVIVAISLVLVSIGIVVVNRKEKQKSLSEENQ
ncbi:MAG: DMT family transporter [Treponema sp.]|nr:DMT family transporter [Treponema sp.]